MHLALVLALGCAHTGRAPNGEDDVPGALTDHFVLIGGTLTGGDVVDVEVRAGAIVALGPVDPTVDRVDVTGMWIAPAFIDSHVHLAYLPAIQQMAAGGVAAGVDLAAPLAFMASDSGTFEIVHAGPMVTAVGGYPTQSWGSDGYGFEVDSPAEAIAAVDDLASRGAGLIKLPVTGPPVLDEASLQAAADRAHELGLKVASHALLDSEAVIARQAGVDVLAHTPTAPLEDSTVDLWASGAVITTLSAFGGRDDTLDNLRRLREAGATVLYGTDFGNTRTAGIDGAEIALMLQSGMDGEAILASATAVPAEYWGLDDLGAIDVGSAASLLILSSDPLVDPSVLASPEAVYIRGVRQ